MRLVPGLIIIPLLCGIAFANRADRDIVNSVVNIFTVYNEADYYRPWQMKGQQSKSGSGCIIEGNRILTNAHVVADQTFIQVKRAGSAEKFVARVEYVGHECDLALLRVNDERFFEGSRPVPLGELPSVRDKVAVYGFPTGGTKVAITEGVVSRVENLYYSHSQASLLCCQIDASINPGSSGGPVLSERELVGVAFQSATGENIGYMVPAPVIRHFLDDVADTRVDGFPTLGIGWQKMENPELRRRYAMADGVTGVLVSRTYPLSPCRGILDSGDVILAVGGRAVASDATVEFREGERTFFEYPAQAKQIGDSLDLRLWRRGAERNVRVKLTIPSNAWQLVPRPQFETTPRYFIIAGLVFVPLTTNFLTTWGPGWATKAPRALVDYYFQEPEEKRREVVFLSQILSDEANVGYDDNVFSVVDTVNGKHVTDLESLVKAFEGNVGEYHEIVDDEGYRIVISRTTAAERKPKILERYKVVFDRSEDLMRGGR